MIFLQHRTLHSLLPHHQGQQGFRLTAQDRQLIRDYRHMQLCLIDPQLEIESTIYGKPVAKNLPQFVFNHSHSQADYALVYSFDVQDLGVDIEDLNRQVKMHALAKRSFHPHEYQTWQSLDYCSIFWFKVWTIKEAILKAHGMGIRLDLHSVDTQAHPLWNFGRVEHALLGVFYYQNIQLSHVMITVAYRQQEMNLQHIIIK